MIHPKNPIRRILPGLVLALAMPLWAANPCRVLVIGDSISVGYTDNPTWRVPYQFGFRSGLYDRLDKNGTAVRFVGGSPEPWDGKFGIPTNTPTLDLRAVNQDHCEGYGGQGTAYIRANIASWLALDTPDLLLLMAGINDIAQGSTAEPTAAEQNLSNIVFTVVNNAPNSRLIVAQITPYSSYTLGIVKYNNYIRGVLVPYFAAQGKHVTTVNQYTNLCAAGTTNISPALFANGINHPSAVAYDRMAQTWFAGIQALSLPSPQAPPPEVNLVTNGGFETPFFGNNTHHVNPAGSSWTFTVGATGAGSGIDRGDPYGSSGSWPIEGAQQAFLQSSGNLTTTRLSRTVPGFTVGQYYQLSFHAKGITGFQGANPFRVRIIDGTTVTPLFADKDIVPSATSYTRYLSEPFRATSPVLTLEFADHGLSTPQKVSWIDAVAVFALPGVPVTGLLDAGQFKIQFSGYTNVGYDVLASTNLSLALSHWSWLGLATPLSNNVHQFVDVAMSNDPCRFYQVRLR
jgi:lysophospholipase L1-like esterase